MKKILLIGQTGQLGQALLKDAQSFGFRIFSFERKDLDITNPIQLEQKMIEARPDILINTSAYHVVSKCEDHPDQAFLVNAIAVYQAAKICRKYQIRFVTYSTDYVFDGKKGSSYLEDDKPNPLQIYGLSKLAGEYAALNYYPEGAFVIRTCGLYGGKKGSPEKGGNFVLNILKEMNVKQVIEVTCEQIVSPTYVGDLSKATLKLLKINLPPGVYHLVNEGDCSWYEFAKKIIKLLKLKNQMISVKRGEFYGGIRRPLYSALKNARAKKLEVVFPSWDDALQRYLKILR